MPRLTPALARTHEGLYPRLEALTHQAEAIAGRKPDAAVPPPIRAAAEALLFDAAPFLPRLSRPHNGARPPLPLSRPLEPAPDTYAALAAVLGQVLARLGAFESRHSIWSQKHAGFVWRLAGGGVAPVQRLRPRSPELLRLGADKNTARLREKLRARFDERYEEGFTAGLKASAPAAGTSD
jgi:hypothetical protein